MAVNPAQRTIIIFQGKDCRWEYTLPNTFGVADSFRGRIRRSFDPEETQEIIPGQTSFSLTTIWTPPNLSLSISNSNSATLIPNCKYSELQLTQTGEVLPYVDESFYIDLPFATLYRRFPDAYAYEVEWLNSGVVNPFIFGGVLVPGEVERP